MNRGLDADSANALALIGQVVLTAAASSELKLVDLLNDRPVGAIVALVVRALYHGRVFVPWGSFHSFLFSC